jgi:aminoglycoside/choline kinase family phosphotransferase
LETCLPADRQQQLQDWVAAVLDTPVPMLVPASADASFRRYFRVHRDGRSYIAMDAPPPQEDCRPFVKVAALLAAAGVHTPEVLAQDLEHGFLLLSDLGTRSYRDVLDAGNADTLFADAEAALLRWQLASRPGVLPEYDRAFLRRELRLFPEWYLGRHLRLELEPAEIQVLEQGFTALEDSALAQSRVYMHRDYMPRNLMLSEPNPGVLDFQDAVFGPISYDIVSLYKDAFLSWEPERVDAWRARYWQHACHARLPVPDDYAEFSRAFDWMGMQRHLKVLGLFARINYRDGKSDYLQDTPRFMAYVRQVCTLYREFTPLLKLLDSVEERAAVMAAET